MHVNMWLEVNMNKNNTETHMLLDKDMQSVYLSVNYINAFQRFFHANAQIYTRIYGHLSFNIMIHCDNFIFVYNHLYIER